MFISIIECVVGIFIILHPFIESDPIDLKNKNQFLMETYDLNLEEVIEETYSLIKVRKNIEGENKRLKRNIKKLLI